MADGGGSCIGGRCVKKVENRKKFANPAETTLGTEIKDRARGKLIKIKKIVEKCLERKTKTRAWGRYQFTKRYQARE